MKLFSQKILPNGRKHIFFCGIKIASYFKRNIVPVYMFKSDVLKYKAFIGCDNIKTVILGSSHGRDGYIPNGRSFNLANSSQDLYRAYKVYEYLTKQKSKCESLRNIVLFWSVFHPGLQLEKTQEYLKCIPYKLFYDAQYICEFPISDKKYLRRLYRQFKKTTVPNNYRGKSLWDINHDGEITSDLVSKHIKNTKRNNGQIQYVQNILDLARKYKHKLYIVLPPYRTDYLKCLPDYKEIYFELFDFLDKNPDVTLLDLQHDKDFNDGDFDSADHCNERGAEKLTKKIDSFLDNIIEVDQTE